MCQPRVQEVLPQRTQSTIAGENELQSNILQLVLDGAGVGVVPARSADVYFLDILDAASWDWRWAAAGGVSMGSKTQPQGLEAVEARAKLFLGSPKLWLQDKRVQSIPLGSSSHCCSPRKARERLKTQKRQTKNKNAGVRTWGHAPTRLQSDLQLLAH